MDIGPILGLEATLIAAARELWITHFKARHRGRGYDQHSQRLRKGKSWCQGSALLLPGHNWWSQLHTIGSSSSTIFLCVCVGSGSDDSGGGDGCRPSLARGPKGGEKKGRSPACLAGLLASRFSFVFVYHCARNGSGEGEKGKGGGAQAVKAKPPQPC